MNTEDAFFSSLARIVADSQRLSVRNMCVGEYFNLFKEQVTEFYKVGSIKCIDKKGLLGSNFNFC